MTVTLDFNGIPIFSSKLLNMKKVILFLVASVALAFHGGHEETDSKLHIGDIVPMKDASFKFIDDSESTLTKMKGEKGLLVVFTATSCPFVVGSEGQDGWQGRYNEVDALAKEAGVEMILVNSNVARRESSDTKEKMQSQSKEQSYTMPMMIDNGSELADAFGAKTTPHVFLFDGNMKLIYTGAIDDNVKSAKDVKETYLKDALNAHKAGKEIKTKSTRAVGCSIKRNS